MTKPGEPNERSGGDGSRLSPRDRKVRQAAIVSEAIEPSARNSNEIEEADEGWLSVELVERVFA